MHVLVVAAILLLALVSVTDSAVVKYTFLVKWHPYNPDGFPRPVIAVFDKEQYDNAVGPYYAQPFPGPTIRATQGDQVEVTIYNRLHESQVSLHFHGLHMLNNPWMDGVDGVTECGIPSRQHFTYRFNTTQVGTYWYHSHSGAQYADGLVGPIVIDPVGTDPIKDRYNYVDDHVVMLQDWLHEPHNILALHYDGPYGSFPGYSPKYPWPQNSLLINGAGQWDCNKTVTEEECIEIRKVPWAPDDGFYQCIPFRRPFLGVCNSSAAPAPADFRCRAPTMRLRVINAGNNNVMRFWIDRHNFTVVARDGVMTQPYERSVMSMTVATRFDIIVKCDQDPNFKYKLWTTVSPPYNPQYWPQKATYAYISYREDVTEVAETLFNVTDLEGPDFEEDTNILQEFELSPLEPKTAPPAELQHVIEFGEEWDTEFGSPLEYWTVGPDEKSWRYPHNPALQSRYRGEEIIDRTIFPANETFQPIVDVLEYGKDYQLVIMSHSWQQHPFHLHGYWLEFIEVGYFNKSHPGWPLWPCGTKANLTELLEYQISDPAPVIAIADSFTIPNWGYVVARIKTNNQGPWFFHCHVEMHILQGMATLLSVERDGRYPDIVPPPNDFKTCGTLSEYQHLEVAPSKGYETWEYGVMAAALGVVIILFVLVAIFGVLAFRKPREEESPLLQEN